MLQSIMSACLRVNIFNDILIRIHVVWIDQQSTEVLVQSMTL